MSFNENPEVTGAGPWSFDPSDQGLSTLGAGDRWRIDLRNMEYNGQPRYFNRYLPLDDALITNRDDSNPVRVVYNDQYTTHVEPNQSRGFDRVGITVIDVINVGGTAIDADNLLAEVSVTGVTADTEARQNAQQGPVSRVVEKFTGLRLGGRRR